MKKIFTMAIICLGISTYVQAQITIAAARAQGAGATVTVSGIVTNGPGEFNGNLRYFQDATGGLAAYSSDVSTLVKGDSIIITGELKDFNGLLEIDPVSNVQKVSGGHPITPKVITLAAGFVEANEGVLVTIPGVTIPGASGTFSGSTNYDISDGSNTKDMRIDFNTDIAGMPVPVTTFDAVGLMGEFNGTYQLLPRARTDISTGGPTITSSLMQTNTTKTSFTVEFTTGADGNAIISYGLTENYELGSEVDNTIGTSHSVDLSGLTPGTIYYVQAASVGGSDTSFAKGIMATISESSGKMKVWFNQPVDNSFNFITPATFVNATMADTLIAFLNDAQTSLDIAIYNLDDNNGIADAINAAHNRGVTVRVIASDNGPVNSGYDLLDAGISKKKSPTGMTYGIMHNKFIIKDINDAARSTLWTGSLNFTDEQIKQDANNVITIQDQTLCKAYQLEFDEMWNGNYGPDKSDNVPHELVINGNRVELYFSPSDNTEQQIKNTIASADDDLYIAVFSYTRFGLSFDIEDRINDGIFAAGVIDDTSSGNGFAYSVLVNSTNGTDRFFLSNEVPGLSTMHNKYMLVDPNNGLVDPLVLTGSHNWSTSANTRNDENTLIVHNQDIANQYFQEFAQRFSDAGGNASSLPYSPVLSIGSNKQNGSNGLTVYPNPTNIATLLNVYTHETGEVQYAVYDAIGRQMELKQFLLQEGKNQIAISTKSWEPGIYFVQLTGTINGTTKLVVNH